MQMTDWGGEKYNKERLLQQTPALTKSVREHTDEAHEFTLKDMQRAVCLELPPPPPFLSPVCH